MLGYEAFQTQDTPEQAEYFTVYIDDVLFPAENVQPVNLARYQGKQTTGDYTRDSDDQQSALILSSFRGGGQKLDAIEGADDERFFDATLESRYPAQLSLQTKTYRHPGPNSVRACPLGDLNGHFYASFDKKLMVWNAGTQSWASGSTDDLSAQPIRKGCEQWGGSLYIPHGSGGYSAFDGASVTHNADIHAVAFAVWDSKLMALTVDGGISFLVDPSATWDEPVVVSGVSNRILPSGHKPRGLEIYSNRNGDPTLFVLTDSRVFSYDASIPKLMPTNVVFPPHPDLGMAFTAHRSESLLSSAGVGVYDYNGSVVAASGLDRDDGLPARYRGNIVDLTPEHNGVYALVEGEQTTVEAGGELWAEQGLYRDDPIELDAVTAESCMWQLTGGAWHNTWTSRGEMGLPTWSHVSTADNDYRLWWGFNGDMFTRKLRRSFHTPQQGLAIGRDEFDPDGYLITPQYDMNMRGFLKLGSQFEVYLKDALGTGETTGSVRISYRTNFGSAWTVLGTATDPGVTVMPMPVNPTRAIHQGLPFIWIQFRFDFEQTTGDIHHSPLLDSIVLKYAKIPLSGRSWVVRVPLALEQYGANDSTVLMRKLNDLVTTPRFVSFVHRDERARVLVSQIVANEATGKVRYGTAVVTLLEVKNTASVKTSAYGLPVGYVP